MNFRKIHSGFYKKDALTLAPRLLGKVLTHQIDDLLLSGIIVEVEAYGGLEDEASHAFRGMKNRNKVMFEEGGAFYVYFTYGNHFCCNVVTGKKGSGEAVLIRALEPISGVDTMLVNRFGSDINQKNDLINLTNGPGKICKALAIDGSLNGELLTGDKIYISEGRRVKSDEIAVSTRIGITKSIELPWRFYLSGNPYVSRKKAI
ncbi:MAG: DNA-3-methyladenine glycosylase [Ignavibacteria bacterium]|nr:DNA-3-methyladenine glycosylase [Ignavibacteria bacterium]